MRCQAVFVSALLSVAACVTAAPVWADYPTWPADDAQSASSQMRPLTAGVKLDKHLPDEQFQAEQLTPQQLAPGEIQPYYGQALTELPYVPGYNGINTVYPAANTRPLYPMQAREGNLPGELSDSELRTLGSFDVVLMQDRSGSMSEKDFFPPGIKMSRWQWCLSQTADLTRQAQNLPHWGVTVVLFSNEYDVYRNVTFSQAPMIYRKEGLHIGTRIAKPLEEQFAEYFRRRTSGHARPLLVAIVTDGKPQDDENLCDLIVRTTHYMQHPREVSVVFLQVGNEEEGHKKLQKFDNALLQRGARFDIVSVVPFYQLSRQGLAHALVQVIRSSADCR